MCLALFLVACVFVWSFLSLEGQRKSGLPNQVQINGTRPSLKITYSRRAIHFKICLPRNLSHFLCPLQPTRNSQKISTLVTVVFERVCLRGDYRFAVRKSQKRGGISVYFSENNLCVYCLVEQ